MFRYLKNLEAYLYAETKKSSIVDINSYYLKTIETLLDIKNSPSLSNYQKIKTFNTYLLNSLENRPSDCFLTMLLPVGDPSYHPDPSSTNILLAQSLNYPKGKKINPSDIVETNKKYIQRLSEDVQRLAFKRTNGVYGLPPQPEDYYLENL